MKYIIYFYRILCLPAAHALSKFAMRLDGNSNIIRSPDSYKEYKLQTNSLNPSRILQNKQFYKQVPFNRLVDEIDKNEVSKIYFTEKLDTVIAEDSEIRDSILEQYSVTKITPLITDRLVELSLTKHVDTVFLQAPEPGVIQTAASQVLGVASSLFWPTLLFVVFSNIFRAVRMGNMNGDLGKGLGMLNGNRNSKLVVTKANITLDSFAGSPEIFRECTEVVTYLKNETIYKQAGAEIPRGILLEGPPGTGKTLLAKAIASEADAGFISVAASEFVELFVGMGASKVRGLFQEARSNKPCIIFIDEIDALARKRGNDMVSSNSEKDQTLNQLLINLDGFKHSNGIFVIGATNRMDLLDPALVRAGRMDKNIFIGNPDADTRRAILRIHVKGKPLSHDVSMSALVEMTGGFSGAQIENLLNEAMLRALRENREIIQMNDLEYITNRVLAGWQSTESKYSEDIIHRIAIHEMGHAVVGFFSEAHPRLSKIYLNLWSPKSPGYTVFESNDEDVNIYTKEGLFSHLMVLLGGRIAEELFFGYSVTTGARKDLDEAYKLAQNMIIQYGMGKQTIYPDLSDQSKYLIDQEVNMLLVKANDAAVEILTKSKAFMLECAKQLKETHTLKAEQMVDIVRVGHLDLWKEYNVTRYLV